MKTIAVIAAALLAGVSAPAFAETVSVRVSYADLDLHSAEGVKTLNRRLAHAVNQVCESNAGSSLDDWQDMKRCRKQAQAGIAPQLARVFRKYGVDNTRVADAR